MSKKFLTEHLNQVFTHRRNSAEKKLAEQNALLATNPPNSQQNENAALKEQQDRIAQEQLILKAKQAMTIRENEVYRLQQESATKKRIAQDQLQKEKELVEQQAAALRIEQEHLAREKSTLRLEREQVLLRIQEQATRDQEALKAQQEADAKDRLTREQSQKEKSEQEQENLRIEREAIDEKQVTLIEERQQITQMRAILELERQELETEKAEQEKILKYYEIPLGDPNEAPQELLNDTNEDADYCIVSLAGEDAI